MHPMAIEVLREQGYSTDDLRSKGREEFAAPGAPRFDFIITVCDNAASETCPVWPGHPMTARWGIEDPAEVKGAGQREAFVRAYRQMGRRISLFLALPVDTPDRALLKAKLREIGQTSE